VSAVVRVPTVNPNDVSALILEWQADEGGWVDKDAAVLTVETSKTSVDVDAPAAGYVLRLAAEGTWVDTGAVVARLYETEAEYAAARDSAAAGSAATPAEAAADRPVTAQARRLAEEARIDLASLPGAGLIRRRDVERALGAAETGEPFEEEVPLHPNHRRVSLALRGAAGSTLPSFVSRAAPAEPILRFLDEARERRAAASADDFFIKALGLALRRHPDLNAQVRGDALRHRSEIAVAVATDFGGHLLAPVIRSPDRLTTAEIVRWRLDVMRRIAKTGTYPSEPATFSLSSLAPLGVELLVPNLVVDQAGTLGIGRRRIGTAVDEWLLCLTFDHQVVNGAYAAAFLGSYAELLAAPEELAGGEPA
jgi:pyruvate dehydrogenase E2 component (dihydrolipoamide acetyltransferase)